MTDIRMVNGKTYIDQRVNSGEPVRLNGVISVDDPKLVKELLGLTFTDSKDNVRPYFKLVAAPAVADEVDELDPEPVQDEDGEKAAEDGHDEDPEVPEVPTPTRRTRKGA